MKFVTIPRKRETETAGPTFHAAATSVGWPDIQDIHGPIECESKFIFSFLPLDVVLEGIPTRHFKLRAVPEERIGLFGEGREIFGMNSRLSS